MSWTSLSFFINKQDHYLKLIFANRLWLQIKLNFWFMPKRLPCFSLFDKVDISFLAHRSYCKCFVNHLFFFCLNFLYISLCSCKFRKSTKVSFNYSILLFYPSVYMYVYTTWKVLNFTGTKFRDFRDFWLFSQNFVPAKRFKIRKSKYSLNWYLSSLIIPFF